MPAMTHMLLILIHIFSNSHPTPAPYLYMLKMLLYVLAFIR